MDNNNNDISLSLSAVSSRRSLWSHTLVQQVVWIYSLNSKLSALKKPLQVHRQTEYLNYKIFSRKILMKLPFSSNLNRYLWFVWHYHFIYLLKVNMRPYRKTHVFYDLTGHSNRFRQIVFTITGFKVDMLLPQTFLAGLYVWQPNDVLRFLRTISQQRIAH